MSALRWMASFSLLSAMLGCIGQPVDQRSPFLTATETYGASLFTDEDEDRRAPGAAAEAEFRQVMTVTLANNNPDAELDVRFAAWINVSSIRDAEQQDELLANGYVQLTGEIRLGSAFTLPPGTYVYNGPGEGGATFVRMPRAQAGEDTGAVATTETFTLITPDVILAFYEPPVSCESKAFVFTDNGFPLDALHVPGDRGSIFEGATGRGGAKTLAQVDLYQCEPLRPGLFFKSGGGSRQPNEYFEGENVRFDFNATPDAGGNFAILTVSSASSSGETGAP